MQIGKDADKIESKFANSQNSNIENTQSVNQENTESINLPDLGLSSALGLFTPKVHGENVEESKKAEELKRKKRNRGMRR